MLTQTSEIAIKALIFLECRGEGKPVAPREIARQMGASPTYLAKVMGQLVKAGILRSQRGPQGGMMLARPPGEITLRQIVEATQGLIVPDYCQAIGDALGPVCGFHRAMWEVRRNMLETMERWTLAELTAEPTPTGELAGNPACQMAFLDT
ncbi:MAG TPA: Rrf2 family transcriptional regulator [Candidatus Sumerlaeota bacterium]|nr:Rrf2 family transcriptional regulator [Candidatus Sumerlaeota bacterium]HOR26914.1 Rrf2 family transcriptional regulator [Candidatus Sumerlaeota bacterium]HPK02372.1 Rrf2 family transcriptional regulator [Candidatus Sumerlaeota bacterium]